MHSSSGTEEALFYLFLAAAFGSFLGNLKIRGTGLGVAMVLFVGLVIGASKPEVKIPEVIKLLGLSIFVYSIGLSSGQAFFSSMKSRGATNLLLAVLALSILSVLTGLTALYFGFDSSSAAGLLAGITTNTPALAGLLDAIQARGGPDAEEMSNSAVVGYSIAYPMGVLGLMIAVAVVRRVLRINYVKEIHALGQEFPSGQLIINCTIQITQPEVLGMSLRDFKKQHGSNVIFGRLRREDQNSLCFYDMVFQDSDLVSITGEVPEVERIGALLGHAVAQELSDDRSAFAMRRIVVSNPKVAGKTIASLNLSEKYPVVPTRLRHGDIDSIIQPGTVLELGDRIRVLAREEDLKELEKVFGDSYEQLSNIDLLSFGLGMGLGILLGSIEMTLPGGILFRLGFAGGPLITGLLLSFLRRSGPILWTLPYSANLTLRQIGLMLLLATIGINSGATFWATMLSPEGPLMLLSGAMVSMVGGFIVLLLGYKILKIPFVLLSGMISHHPANLDYANNLAQNKIPTQGYALVYPLLLIGKIIFVQLLWQFLPQFGG